MNTEERIRLSRLIEKATRYGDYSRKLGLENCSRLHGKKINSETGEKNGWKEPFGQK